MMQSISALFPVDLAGAWGLLADLWIGLWFVIQLLVCFLAKRVVRKFIPLMVVTPLWLLGRVLLCLPGWFPDLIQNAVVPIVGFILNEFAPPSFIGVGAAWLAWLLIRLLRFLIRRVRPNPENHTP